MKMKGNHIPDTRHDADKLQTTLLSPLCDKENEKSLIIFHLLHEYLCRALVAHKIAAHCQIAI